MSCKPQEIENKQRASSLMVRILPSQGRDPGSIPGLRIFFKYLEANPRV